MIPVRLDNDKTIMVEVGIQAQETDVAFRAAPFRGITEAIEGIAAGIFSGLRRVQPSRATVEFGLEVSVDSGQLTALVLKGAATANFQITLEWAQSAEVVEPGGEES